MSFLVFRPRRAAGLYPVLLTLAWLLLCAAPSMARAQAADPIAEARRLRDAGEPDAAAAALRPYLAANPGDAGVHWLMAQLLRDAGRRDAAAEHYAAALRGMPADPWLRLEYAELQTGRGEWDDAAALLRPLAGAPDAEPAAVAAARAALAQLELWRGDLPAARRRAEAALGLEPAQPRALAVLAELRALTRPWARAQLRALDDNQPYRQAGAALELGAYLTPLWTVSAGVTPTRRATEAPVDGAVPDGAAQSVDAWLGTGGFLPGAQLEWALRGGAVWEDAAAAAAPAWTGAASLARRLPGGVSLRAAVGREPYRATLAALDTLLLVDAAELRLDRAAAPGWAGEVVLRGERFGDGNTIRTAYAWLLAPLLPHVRGGYAFAWQDAEHSTWSPRVGPAPPADGTAPGFYDPYYTPEQLRVHSVLGELSAPLGPATLTLSGALGVHAREQAPVLLAAGAGQPTVPPRGPPGRPAPEPTLALAFHERAFEPWRAAAALSAPLGRTLTLRAEAERERTAFYQSTRLLLGATYRFGAP